MFVADLSLWIYFTSWLHYLQPCCIFIYNRSYIQYNTAASIITSLKVERIYFAICECTEKCPVVKGQTIIDKHRPVAREVHTVYHYTTKYMYVFVTFIICVSWWQNTGEHILHDGRDVKKCNSLYSEKVLEAHSLTFAYSQTVRDGYLRYA